MAEPRTFMGDLVLKEVLSGNVLIEPFAFILTQLKGSLSLLLPQNGPKG